ncbi:MAG: hypothetical protein Ta2A_01610 [Treponemataceae bacterium]|nr:MAG: hypothetical protein Ta2A_01610 [Treponemataceae bacterium]
MKNYKFKSVAKILVLSLILFSITGCGVKETGGEQEYSPEEFGYDVTEEKVALINEKYLEKIYKMLQDNSFLLGVAIDPELVKAELAKLKIEEEPDTGPGISLAASYFVYLNDKPALYYVDYFGSMYLFTLYSTWLNLQDEEL